MSFIKASRLIYFVVVVIVDVVGVRSKNRTNRNM
jgi:hypothetical protein